MKQSGLQRTGVRILLTVLTAAVMVLIFGFSMEPAEKSDVTSGRISRTVISLIHPDYETYPEEKKEALYDDVQHAVRKTAHFTEYMILGALMLLCLESWFGPGRFLALSAWAVSTLYASSDELHQRIIDGRSGQVSDVLLDSSGVLAGVLLMTLIRRVLRKKGKKQPCP